MGNKAVEEAWKRYYDNKRRRMPIVEKNFELMRGYIPVEGLILDAGSGDGLYTEKLREINRKVVAFDIRKGYSMFADVNNLPFKEDSFNLIICMSVLQYVDDPRKPILEFDRALKNGGFLVFSIPSKLYKLLSRATENKNIKGFSKNSIRSLFKNTKFEIELMKGSIFSHHILCIAMKLSNTLIEKPIKAQKLG